MTKSNTYYYGKLVVKKKPNLGAFVKVRFFLKTNIHTFKVSFMIKMLKSMLINFDNLTHVLVFLSNQILSL